MKKHFILLLGFILFSQPAHASLATVRAAEQQVLTQISQIVQAYSVYVGTVAAAVSSARSIADGLEAGYLNSAKAALNAVNATAAQAVSTVQAQAAAAVSAAWNTAVAYARNFLINAPWLYAQAFEQARLWFVDQQTQASNWLATQYAAITTWVNDNSAPIYAWYNASIAPVEDGYKAIQQAGQSQMNAANQVASAKVQVLQAQYKKLQDSEALADCPLPGLEFPVISCTGGRNSRGAIDVYLGFSTAQGPRGFNIYIPANVATVASLLIDLHGYGQNSAIEREITRFDLQADNFKFVLVTPDGKDNSWNAGACCGNAMSAQIDDVAFIKQIIVWIESFGGIDSNRVFVSGLSNGGMMAQRLACELSRYVAGIATNVGPNGQYPNGDYYTASTSASSSQTRMGHAIIGQSPQLAESGPAPRMNIASDVSLSGPETSGVLVEGATSSNLGTQNITTLAINPTAVKSYACNPVKRVSILMLYGNFDSIVPFYGGNVVLGGNVLFKAVSANTNFEIWSTINGCGSAKNIFAHNGNATGYENTSCPAGVKVQQVTVNGGMHQWFNYNQNGVDSSTAIISFFASL